MAFVWAYHEVTGGVALHPEQAQDDLWSRLGWERVDVDYAAASGALGTPVARADQLPASYVLGLARAAGPPAEPPAVAEPGHGHRRATTKESS